ncbi:Metallo-beta-lactamase superfamily protein [Bradyrhizobium sp. Ghvi]|nr:Metallo-beta-lactamase superfamily protein [Bradyrhizobium sp. Ghvi]
MPTFPNARYIFSKAEQDHWTGPAGQSGFNAGVYADSVLPVIEHRQAEIIDGDGLLANGLAVHATPGHSPGHVVFELADGGEKGLFGGDIMPQPLQVFRPDWNSAFCDDPAKARASRRWLLERAADDAAKVFTAHFAASSAGFVTRNHEGFDWLFA